VQARRGDARRRAESLRLEANGPLLRRLAEQLEAVNRQAADLERWRTRRDERARAVTQAQDRLCAFLEARGASPREDLGSALADYRAACNQRARIAAEAARAEDLERQVGARRTAEKAAAEAQATLERIRATLRRVATDCGVSGDEDSTLVAGLRKWLDERSAKLTERDGVLREYAELKALLAGASATDVEEKLGRKVADLERLAGSIQDAALAAAPLADLDARIDELARDIRRRGDEAARLDGEARERARQMPSIGDAEDELAASVAELARVELLGETLERTRQFLERAQERVHRDIATVLRGALNTWLPRVTGGRYSEAGIDPGTLKVTVKDRIGEWRDGTLLSHGTAEQIYMLLRLAMAQHLTREGEVSPIVLDEVTVQSDRERTRAMLDLLLTISADRQIILFTQEEDVLLWSQQNLAGERHRLTVLPGPTAGALIPLS
jgi:DNA repair exonuclease SbcCD ATPase subunit